MIEDLQDVNNSYQIHEDNGQPNRAGMLLLAFIVWVVFSTVIILVSAPKIQVALKETNAVEVFRNRKNLRDTADQTTITLYFVEMKDYSEYGLLGFKTDVRKGTAGDYHDALEGLLQGPSDQALSHGAISMIPKGTKLNGVTVSNRIAYVDFSSEFIEQNVTIDENYQETARWQILKTLQAVDASLREVEILINGKRI